MESSLAMPLRDPLIDIVIVNWNSGSQLRDCVASVRSHHSGLVGKCIVIDNQSRDGSADFLDGAKDVDLVRAGQNLGFGRACNLGVARGSSPFILLLNPDACLTDGSLSVSANFLQNPNQASVGIVGLQLRGEDGEVQRSCARFPEAWNMVARSIGFSRLMKQADFHMHEWDHLRTRAVDHVIGAYFLVRRNLYDDLGGMDERFFVYLEDIDFSYRAAQAGFSTIYLAEAWAFHKGGGVSEQVKAHRLFYSLRSRLQYAFKHFSVVGAVAVTVSTLMVEPVSRLLLLIKRRCWSEINDLRLGYRMLWGWAVPWLIKRAR